MTRFFLFSWMVFVANVSEQNILSEKTRQNQLDLFAEVIATLAGDKPNLKISLQDVKLSIGNAKIALNGEVVFNLIYAAASETKIGA